MYHRGSQAFGIGHGTSPPFRREATISRLHQVWVLALLFVLVAAGCGALIAGRVVDRLSVDTTVAMCSAKVGEGR